MRLRPELTNPALCTSGTAHLEAMSSATPRLTYVENRRASWAIALSVNDTFTIENTIQNVVIMVLIDTRGSCVMCYLMMMNRYLYVPSHWVVGCEPDGFEHSATSSIKNRLLSESTVPFIMNPTFVVGAPGPPRYVVPDIMFPPAQLP